MDAPSLVATASRMPHQACLLCGPACGRPPPGHQARGSAAAAPALPQAARGRGGVWHHPAHRHVLGYAAFGCVEAPPASSHATPTSTAPCTPSDTDDDSAQWWEEIELPKLPEFPTFFLDSTDYYHGDVFVASDTVKCDITGNEDNFQDKPAGGTRHPGSARSDTTSGHIDTGSIQDKAGNSLDQRLLCTASQHEEDHSLSDIGNALDEAGNPPDQQRICAASKLADGRTPKRSGSSADSRDGITLDSQDRRALSVCGRLARWEYGQRPSPS